MFEHYESETELKAAGTKFLKKLLRCKLLKTDNMPLIVKRRRTKTRNPGMADHHLCFNGLFVAIEAKMPGKELDTDQRTYRDDILKAGGIFIVYHSVLELKTELIRNKLIKGETC